MDLEFLNSSLGKKMELENGSVKMEFMLLNIVKKSMKGPVKIFFGQSKIHVRY